MVQARTRLVPPPASAGLVASHAEHRFRSCGLSSVHTAHTQCVRVAPHASQRRLLRVRSLFEVPDPLQLGEVREVRVRLRLARLNICLAFHSEVSVTFFFRPLLLLLLLPG